MSTWGNNSSTSTATRNIESEGRGIEIAVGEAGNITSGRAKLSDGVANAHDCKMEIYDNTGNHLGSSDVLENGVSTSLGYVDFTFSAQIPVDNETIRAYAWGDNLGSGLNLAYDGGSGRNFQGLATYPTAPDPDGSGTDGRYYAVSVTVTPSASGVSGTGTGTLTAVTAAVQGISLDPGWEQIVFSGNTPPVDEKSLAREVLVDYPAIPEVVAGDIFGVESHADITWDTNTQAVLDPNGAHELGYWFWDVSTLTQYTGTITLSLYQGTAVGTLSPITGAVSGLSKEFVGQGSGILQTVTGNASGGVGGMFGTGDGVLEAITAVGVGGFTTSSVYGGATATLEAITSNASGNFGPTGSAAGLLQAVLGNASGINTTSVIGSGSGVLNSVIGDSVGTVPLDYVVLSTHKLVVPYEDNLLRVN